MGIRFLANWAEFFFGTIIYRLVMRNHDLDSFSEKFKFWRENGRGRHAGARGSRASRPDQKVAQSGGTFGSTVILEKCF